MDARKPDLTPEQQVAIKARTSVAIRAGAGTGKTFTLTQRYLHHIIHDGLRPLEVVAVTFTEQAAEELRSRIRLALEQKHIEEQKLYELDAAPIGTLHSLAARICRNFPEEAGVPAQFRVRDEVEGVMYWATLIDQVLDQLGERFYEHLSPSDWRGILQELLAHPYEVKQALQHSWTPDRKKQLVKAWWQRFRQVIIERLRAPIATLQQAEVLDPRDKWVEMRERVLQAWHQILHASELPVAPLRALLHIDLRGGSQKAWRGGTVTKKEIKEAFNAIREQVAQWWNELISADLAKKYSDKEVAEWLKSWTADDQVLAQLQEQVRQVYQILETLRLKRMHAERALTFNDLEVHALQALQDEKVRTYYHQRWRAILVDEFQDTSHIQGALLQALVQDGDIRYTIVGDEKQSIYGFRGADVQVFTRAQEHIQQERKGNSISLRTSFRMHQKLTASINHIFSHVFGDTYEALEASREQDREFPVQCYVLDEDEDMTRWERVRIEGRWIASEIQRLLHEEKIADKQTHQLRPVQYGDIAILARAWQVLDEIELFLQEAGIPTINVGGGNLLETKAGRDVRALLHFLADPTHDLALVTLLRSPFFGVSDPELVTFAQQINKGVSWWQAMQEATELPAALKSAQTILAPYIHHYRYVERPLALVQRLNETTGYRAILANLPAGRRQEADWVGMLDFIQRYEQQGVQDVFTLVRWLKELEGGKMEIPRPLIQAQDAVSLMTIHAAKGLEWPVVFMARLARRIPGTFSKLYVSPEWGVACWGEYLDEESKDRLVLIRFLREEYLDRERDERKRLAYVGATRARDQLYLTRVGTSKDGLWKELECALGQAGVLERKLPRLEESSRPIRPPVYPEPTLKVLDSLQVVLTSLSVTALVDFAQCPRKGFLLHIEGHPGTHVSAGWARQIGRLVHEAICRDVYSYEALQKLAPEVPDHVIQEAFELIKRFVQAPVYQEVRQQIREKEYPVVWRGGSLLYRGRIDALGDDFLVDFKTDQEMAPAHHALQLWVYQQATQRKAVYIAYLRHDVLYRLSQEELEEAACTFKRVESKILNGDREPAPHPLFCAYCPFLDICREGQSMVESK